MSRLRTLLALALLGCGTTPASGGYMLRYASPYPPQHPFSRADKTWIAYVEAQTHGQLRIEAFWSGSLLSADQNIVELRHRVADVAAIQPIYTRAGTRALRTQVGFYAGANGFEQQVAVYECLAQRFPALTRGLAGLHVLAVQGGNLPGIVTRTQAVRRLHDLVGLRLRAPAELIDLLRALGADPVYMPMSDVYAALAKGVIDGVVAPIDTLRALHLAEVAHYYAQLAIPRGAYPARAINVRVLEHLPQALQRVLRASSPVWEAALAAEIERGLKAGRAYGTKEGMQFTQLPEAEQRAFDRAYAKTALAQARALSAPGVDGVALLRAAQDWIARMRDGEPARASALCGRHAS